ncbi:MAG: hypothetical protein JF628_07175 [Sphingomonas sp.]|nr:hypothetical protein [Sphingomonas sp.]
MLFTPSVEVEEDHLLFRPWLFRKRVPLDSIHRIESLRRDLVTYEENYLLLFLDDGRMFWLGEMSAGFRAAEAKLRERFATFDQHWMERLERNSTGVRQIVWDREQVAPGSARLTRLRKRLRRGPAGPRLRID